MTQRTGQVSKKEMKAGQKWPGTPGSGKSQANVWNRKYQSLCMGQGLCAKEVHTGHCRDLAVTTRQRALKARPGGWVSLEDREEPQAFSIGDTGSELDCRKHRGMGKLVLA